MSTLTEPSEDTDVRHHFWSWCAVTLFVAGVLLAAAYTPTTGFMLTAGPIGIMGGLAWIFVGVQVEFRHPIRNAVVGLCIFAAGCTLLGMGMARDSAACHRKGGVMDSHSTCIRSDVVIR